MKFSLDQASFMREIALLQGVIEKKSTFPILHHVLLKATEDGRVTMVATGLGQPVNRSQPKPLTVVKTGTDAAPVGVVDYARLYTPIASQFAQSFVAYPDEASAKSALLADKIAAYVVIPNDYMATGKVTMYTKSVLGVSSSTDTADLRVLLVKGLLAGKVDETTLTRAAAPMRIDYVTLDSNMIYAIDEALKMVFEEGLEARFERHHANHRALLAGLEALGISPSVSSGSRLWMLNSVCVPDGVDDREVRGRLLARHGIEIGGGLGPLAGKIWRIGLMGESSRIENVRRLLACLAIELRNGRGNDAVDAADRCS